MLRNVSQVRIKLSLPVVSGLLNQCPLSSSLNLGGNRIYQELLAVALLQSGSDCADSAIDAVLVWSEAGRQEVWHLYCADAGCEAYAIRTINEDEVII